MKRAALLPLAVICAGCGSSGPKVVEWAGLRPPAQAPAAPCRGSQLQAVGGLLVQPATQGLVGGIVLRNVRSAPCSLVGQPRVRFDPGLSRQKQLNGPPGGEGRFPDSWLRSLSGTRAALIRIQWLNWCGPPPTKLRIALPGGRDKLVIPVRQAPPCVNEKSPSTVVVGPFAGWLTKQPAPWTRLQLAAKVLGGRLSARRGQILRYRVEVTNESDSTLTFGQCPLLTEALDPAGVLETFVLNCGPAGKLAPGKSVIFENELPVPRTAQLGVQALSWELDPYASELPSANGQVDVKP